MARLDSDVLTDFSIDGDFWCDQNIVWSSGLLQLSGGTKTGWVDSLAANTVLFLVLETSDNKVGGTDTMGWSASLPDLLAILA